VGFYRFFDLFCGGKCIPHPVDCRRRVAFSCGSGSLEQSGDLTQLLAEFLSVVMDTAEVAMRAL
jgi:hypothetical protein